MATSRPYTLILGVIGADVHVIGITILAHALREAGFNVVNLGIMVSQEEFIAAAIEVDADALLVSSLYGHGEIDAEGLRDHCREAGIGDILMYLGGNLVVGKHDFKEVESKFRDMGFDRVFPPGTLPDDVLAWLNSDLASRAARVEETP
ncbi:methylaspartate mutase subunit S [bacterium]|nr:MAG: methylaspartate mutase subunit S [bacterium]